MERKIGEIFEYNGEWYQCIVKGFNCTGCDVKDCPNIRIGACSSHLRNDGRQVKFKKLEKVGEPYMAHDHSRNKDVVVQDYKLYNQHACYNGHEEMLSFGLYGKVGMVTIKSKEPIKSLNCENSVEIEIKQTNKDMEEKKLNLKPFDIQKAREGKPVCTRDGGKARILCFDRVTSDNYSKVVACITTYDGKDENVLIYGIDGYIVDPQHPKPEDLMMLPEKKEGWINIYNADNGYSTGGIYSSKEEAEKQKDIDCVATIKIEWEE